VTIISGKYLGALLAVLLVALVPTVRHGYVSTVAAAPSVTPDSVPANLEGVPGATRERPAAWIADTYGADSWAERTYDVGGHGQVRIFVARGYDLKKLYHHPELGILHGVSLVSAGAVPLEGHPDRRVHVLRSDRPGETSALYALVYRGAWIADPYRLQLSSALSSLWDARHPLTLILVAGAVADIDGKPTALGAKAVNEAWQAIEATDAAAAGGAPRTP